jgi:RNA polymerase sigma-70 factor (ECF subfamily)
VVRAELCGEAIRLARQLHELRPSADVEGLLALLLLQDARRGARSRDDGSLVVIADQDRTLWDRAQIVEGLERVARALATPPLAAYTIEAAIAAMHCRSKAADLTDWDGIVRLYDLLVRADGSDVVQLNRAVAVAMRDGPRAGLELIDALLARGRLTGFRYAHAARADLLRRLGDVDEARAAYAAALELSHQEAERRFLEQRLAELETGSGAANAGI